MADNSIMLYLGSGRTVSGRIGTEVGFNANLIRNSSTPWFATGAKIRKTGDVYRLPIVQSHYTTDNGKKSLEGQEAIGQKDNQWNRGIIRFATLEEYEKNPNFA